MLRPMADTRSLLILFNFSLFSSGFIVSWVLGCTEGGMPEVLLSVLVYLVVLIGFVVVFDRSWMHFCIF